MSSSTEHGSYDKPQANCLPPKGPFIGQRHLFILLSHLGIAVMYCMRVNLNIALVAMVNETALSMAEGNAKYTNISSQCPPANISSGSSQTLRKDGEYVWSRELQGMILSSFFWGYLVLQIPAGTLTQRFGGKRALLVGVLWISVFTLITPWVVPFGPIWLIALRVLEGIGSGVTFPTIQSMMGRWIPLEEISFQQSIAFSGGTIGTIVGQLAAGSLCASPWGWPSAFYVTGAAGILWCLPWSLFITDSPESNSRISTEELAYITYHLGQGAQETSNRNGVPWCKIMTDRGVWAVVTIIATSSWVFYVLLNCLPQYLSDVLQFDISNDGILSSLPYMAGLPGSLIAGYFIDVVIAKSIVRAVYVRKIIVFAGSIGVSICLYTLTFVPCNVVMTLVLLISMICLMNAAGAGFTPNIQELSPEYSGTLYGLCNTIATVAGIFAPYITDLMTPNRTIQQWMNVFFLATGMSCFGAFIYVLFASTTYRPWNFTIIIEDRTIVINEDEEIALIAEEVAAAT